MIGIRLKLARRAAGFSLRGLAAAIGHRVTAQAIGKYERNEAMPGSGVLLALADALNTSVDYLLGDPDLVLEDLEFRKKAFTTSVTKLRSKPRYSRISNAISPLRILQLPSAQWDELRDAPYPVRHDPIEADRAADALRHHWGLGHEPIRTWSSFWKNEASRYSPSRSAASAVSPREQVAPDSSPSRSSS